jgi:hypothetical protein
MNIIANEYHPAIFYVLLHGSSETTLSIFCELVCFIYDQNLKILTTFGLNVAVGSDFFDNILNDMSIVVIVVRRSHFDVIVACKYAIFNGC